MQYSIKMLKSSDTSNKYQNYPENGAFGFLTLCSNDAKGMANSVDPDQTAPLGAV